ncbi:hypothetical protein D3C72_1900090 [compost metagenome]
MKAGATWASATKATRPNSKRKARSATCQSTVAARAKAAMMPARKGTSRPAARWMRRPNSGSTASSSSMLASAISEMTAMPEAAATPPKKARSRMPSCSDTTSTAPCRRLPERPNSTPAIVMGTRAASKSQP